MKLQPSSRAYLQEHEDKQASICSLYLSWAGEPDVWCGPCVSESLPFFPLIVFKIKLRDPTKAFCFEKLIGRGTFGSVYRAINLKTGQLNAVKVMNHIYGKVSDEIEVEILQKCKHPNIIKLIDFFKWKKSLFLCMELSEHGDLHRVAKRYGPFNESQLGLVAFEVLDALAYLNSKGFMHRDIKPDNILLNDACEVTIVDFGLAARTTSYLAKYKRCGTLEYMAPEVVLPAKHPYNEKCDIWSLGITIMELAECRPPLFFFTKLEVLDYWKKNMEPPRLKEPHKWSRGFQDFVSDCLRVDPARRPKAKQLLDITSLDMHLV
uniref:Protein kinase domain-containing protein n=1 Tax=Denticeps clupeoides TaxID=299321 RepID=A0AAY4F0G2_9TELE